MLTIPLQMLDVSIGYIRGTIFDFGIFGLMYEQTHWVNLLLLGAINFVVFYVVFRFAIARFDIKTPGRESETSDSTLLNNKEYDKVAELVIQGLGGSDNIKHVENCVSRLRVDVKDQKKMDMTVLKESGSLGTFIPSSNHVHVVFGPHVEFVRNAVDDRLVGAK
ncbi:glucose PTS transporter subunit EIIB [Citrobacter amalonaticus]|uniref:glucose PTS transporter subunit EIIB n=1 Tax=Citrobacter amalonaticus TaxID=35703 RepID=UPI001E415E33|nr:glucose PTS transporter subunit EIIB [Citrobacter amalonaticus]